MKTSKIPTADGTKDERAGRLSALRDSQKEDSRTIPQSSTKDIALENPEIFRQIYTDGPLGIAISTANGSFLSANCAFCRMMGYTEMELAAMTFRDITHPEHLDNDIANVRKLLSNEIPIYRTEKRYICKDKHVFWGSLTLSALRDTKGHVLYHLIMVEDISDRKQAQITLEENEERFRKIFEQAPISMAIVGMSGTIEYINKKAIATFGYLPEDIPDMNHWWAKAYPDEKYRQEVITTWTGLVERALREQREIERREYQVSRKNGSTITTVIFGVPVANKVFVMFDDITERKRTEAAIKESEEMFRNLAEQSPNMIFIYKHLKNRIVYANRQCEVLSEFSLEEIYSQDFNYINLIAPEFHQDMYKAFKRHMAGQELPLREYDMITKSGKRIATALTTKPIQFHGEPAILGVITDVTEMKKVQADIIRSSALLKEQQKSLQEKNIALREILAQIETEKLDFKKQVTLNVEKMLLPAMSKLRVKASALDKRYINMLEQNIMDLLSKFGLKLSSGPTKLSPRELEICNMIKNGISSKEIAEMLHLSLRTVDTHRNRIRRKLKINATDVNLASHLQNLT